MFVFLFVLRSLKIISVKQLDKALNCLLQSCSETVTHQLTRVYKLAFHIHSRPYEILEGL